MTALTQEFSKSSSASFKSISNLVEQAVHDIHSPLAALKAVVDGLVQIGDSEKRILNSALSRLEDIVSHIAEVNSNVSEKSQSNLVKIESEELINILSTLVEERNAVFSTKTDVVINFKNLCASTFNVLLPKLDFLRSLTNLINNAAEACNDKGTVDVIVSHTKNNLHIKIKDNGKGMSQEILNQIGARGASFNKESGSGLGLYHAQKMMKSINGALVITSVENQGSEIELKIAMQSTIKDSFYEYVLIDNDELVRLTWETKAKTAGVSLLSLSCPELLKNYFDKISKTETQIYIDSNLDNFVRGEFVAKSLYEKGFQNLFMATGYESSRFNSYKFLKCVGKQPPFKK